VINSFSHRLSTRRYRRGARLRTAVHQMVWPAGTARPQPITAFMDGFERPYRAVGGIGSGRQFWGREHAREPSILDVPAPPIRRGRSIQSSDAGCAKHCWIQPGEHRWRERRHGDQSSASGCASGDVGAPELARGDEQRARLDEQTNAGAHGGHRAGKDCRTRTDDECGHRDHYDSNRHTDRSRTSGGGRDRDGAPWSTKSESGSAW